MFKAAIFDIDATLVLTGSAGLRALAYTFSQLDSDRDPERLPEHYSVHGKTDPLIFNELYLEFYGRSPTALEQVDLRRRYLDRLPFEMEKSASQYRVLPGVYRLLDRLEAAGISLGLGTGNYVESARIKLAPADLNRRFAFGGYGSDAENRADMLRVAIDRCRNIMSVDVEEIIVIGDTTRDIDAAKEVGLAVIGVATGTHSVDKLSIADLAVESLESEAVYKFIAAG